MKNLGKKKRTDFFFFHSESEIRKEEKKNLDYEECKRRGLFLREREKVEKEARKHRFNERTRTI